MSTFIEFWLKSILNVTTLEGNKHKIKQNKVLVKR